MQVVWNEEGLKKIPLSEEVKKKVEEQVKKLSLEEIEKLGEYEETGDEYVLPEPDPYEGLYVKIVKHKGKYKLVAGIWEHAYREEYYVAILQIK